MRLTPAAPRTPSPAAAGLVVWRLTIAAVSLVGFCLAMLNGTRRWHWLGMYEWSQLTTLCACLVALAGVAAPAMRPGEPVLGILRGAACGYVMVTMIGYRLLIGGDYSRPSSLLEHLVVPLLVLVDWLFVCRGQARLRWWWPLAWLLGPTCYLALYVQGAQLYQVSPYLVLTYGSTTFWPNAILLIASFAPLFFAVWGAPRILRLARAAAPQPQPQRV
jgi:hypothetical protein